MKKRFLTFVPPEDAAGRFPAAELPFPPQFRPRFSASLASAPCCSALPVSAWKLRRAVRLTGNLWHSPTFSIFYIKSKVDNLCPP